MPLQESFSFEKPGGGLKRRIEKCQTKWNGLKEQLSLRIAVDTNIHAHDTNTRVRGIGDLLQGVEDRELGIAELVFFSMINDNNSFNSPSGEDS